MVIEGHIRLNKDATKNNAAWLLCRGARIPASMLQYTRSRRRCFSRFPRCNTSETTQKQKWCSSLNPCNMGRRVTHQPRLRGVYYRTCPSSNVSDYLWPETHTLDRRLNSPGRNPQKQNTHAAHSSVFPREQCVS